jgi:RHS repeat-associated protein
MATVSGSFNPDLPPLTVEPSPPGTVTEGTVGPEGGRVDSGDGRVSIVFPPGATSEQLLVRITTLDVDELVPLAGRHLIGAWNLEAFTAASMTRVDRFNAEVTLNIQFGFEAMSWANPRTLRLWTLDAQAGSWLNVSGQEVSLTGVVSARTDHLSVWGGTADPAVDTAPFSDVSDLDLHSGAATASIPIELPPAPGGLVPQLALTYDSSRVGSMRRYDALGSWVGIGWDLSVGSIREIGDHPPAYFLELGGAAQRLYPDPTSNTRFLGYRHSYLKIEASRADCVWEQEGAEPCTWTVTDKQGRRYIFGGTADSRQYRIAWPGRKRYYRWDLSRIEDNQPGLPGHSNYVEVTYWQQFTRPQFCGSCIDYVLSAYPDQITYGFDGANKVMFNRGFDYVQTDYWPYNAQVRWDTPHSWFEYFAPEVMETHRLDSIDTKVNGQSVQRYEFNYTTTKFHARSDKGYAGKHRLDSVTVKGRNGNPLRTMTFVYQDLSFGTVLTTFTWPHLTGSDNGFSGKVFYTYEEKRAGCPVLLNPWSRQVVIRRERSAGADQPSVVTNYTYYDGPHEVEGDYRGFGRVIETDVHGNKTTHWYYTTHLSCTDATIGDEDIFTGLEYKTEVKDSADFLWLKTENTWGKKWLAGTCSYPYYPLECSHFVYLNQTNQTLRDGTQVRTRYPPPPDGYDDYGNLQRVYQDGNVAVTTDDSVIYRPHHQNTTAWIFLPKFEQVQKPDGTVLAETSYFYDGAGSRDTAPTVGNLTAVQSRLDQADVTKTTNVYRVYDTYGNLTKESVPTTVTPIQSSDPLGYIPQGVPYSSLDYDAYFTYVDAETNPLNQTTTYTIDSVIGRPTQVNNPDGSHLYLRYDEFGRLTKKWDDLDSETYPTTAYEYYWTNTAGSKWTNVIYRANAGSPDTLWETHCYDGFGRQIQVRTPFTAGSHSVVDTNYDTRGLRQSVTNPYEEFSGGCSAPSPSAPRTTYAYDPLGGVSQVTNPDGTSVTVDRNGLTTTAIDENGHKKAGVADAFGRTVKVEEYTGTAPTFALYATTLYSYDLLGNLKEVRAAAGLPLENVTTMTYDMLGRKTAMSDPDAGSWQYAYDVAGNLIEEVGPEGAHSGRTYDALNRQTSRWYVSPSNPVVQFTYDSYDPASPCSGSTAVGRLTKMVDQSGSTYWCYDQRGRVVRQRKSLDGVDYDVQSTYDSANRLRQLTYPDGEVVAHSYDPNHGQLRSLSSSLGGSYLNNVAYNPALQPTSLPLGNGLGTAYGYDNRLRLTSIATGGTQNLAFTYDGVGNVRTITDDGVQTAFAYDELDRLVSASGAYTATYDYNQIGNMTRKQEGGQDLDLRYQNPVHVHAVTLVRDRNTGPVANLAYDLRGNLAVEGPNLYEYDMDNRLVSIRTAEDTDGDGCTAAEEYPGAPSPKPGSTCSSPQACYSDANWYDFYDVPAPANPDPTPNGAKSKSVTMSDVMAVLFYVGTYDGGPPNGNGVDYDSDKNGDTIKDGRDYDRSPSALPNPPWEAGPPNGAVNMADVQAALAQVGLACTGQPTTVLTAQYVYDGQGNLVKRFATEGGWTTYIGGIYEKRSDGTYIKYYSAFGRRIAMRDNAGVHYILADHLGSSSVVTNSAGAVVGTMKYYPYGGERSATGDMGTDKLFTGQQREAGTGSNLGLYNYGARFYSTLTGRFLSPDPLIATPGDPQVLNAYSYVHNNPLKYVDPMGLCFTMPDGTQLECTPKLWQQWLDCALNGACGPDVQVLARAGIQQDEFWDHAWEYVYQDIGWVFVETILKGISTLGGPSLSTPEAYLATFRQNLANQLNLVPEYGWRVIAGIFAVPWPFFKASLYDMIAGTATIARLGLDSIIGTSPWWRDSAKGAKIERLYGVPWNERSGDLEDVLRWKTIQLADALQALGDINELRWSSWQRELVHGRYGVDLAEPYRGMPPPCAFFGTCLPPLLPPIIAR